MKGFRLQKPLVNKVLVSLMSASGQEKGFQEETKHVAKPWSLKSKNHPVCRPQTLAS